MTVASDSSPECFSRMMASMPGFRFHPTDEELVMYYLKRKMCRRKLKLDVIREIDVYKWDPEDFVGQSVLKTGDRQWFFFSPRDRKYPNSGRTNRATRYGYWKATGKDRNITYNSRTVGVKKTLVFYRGRAPHGERTDWVMHEYTLEEEEVARCQNFKDYYALYKVFKKSGPGPKNGEQYGAPFIEEEWGDDDFVDVNVNSADEAPISQVDEGPSVHTGTCNGQAQPLFDLDLDEVLKRMMDELVPDLPSLCPALPQVPAEDVLDQISKEVTIAEPIKMFHSSGHCYDPTQSATAHMHVSEAPEVTSAPSVQLEEPLFHEDDFLEMNDLIDPEPALPEIENPVENMEFEDGLSAFDLFHDAEMFLRDMGHIDQETVSHPYVNTLESNVVNQHYQSLPLGGNADQSCELWMRHESHIMSPTEHANVSFSSSTSGVVYESASLPTEGNRNQSGSVRQVPTSRLSSALWAFLESIPTTPASAAENANRALERVSSFSRVRDNVKQASMAAAAVAAGNENAIMKRAGKGKGIFLFLPVLVALCAFLWVSMGTLRLLGSSFPDI
ncbi:NAC domain-containing protein 17-like [Prosopis cineraria]|uniref:NAC domain-containing protein 17-like n=1 Tax=Prosopis cineraria TaxID=364024 RepID=UPI00240FCE3B|nr:NAC domain-containing protein 17-like [Prosopis cineraria]